VHSTDYLRRSSTPLFAAVLAVASKFFRKDLYPMLLSHAQTIVDRAVIAGAEDTGLVQSLMLLVYWKAPSDTSSWRRIGWAIRMGYQFRWHLPRNRALPSDELTARQLLVSCVMIQRLTTGCGKDVDLWVALCCSSYSLTTGTTQVCPVSCAIFCQTQLICTVFDRAFVQGLPALPC
jgi:hypothetical protein